MTRALLGCTIVLTLAVTAHAQNFDPLYKPKPGDEAVIGRPILLYSHPEMKMSAPRVVFIYDNVIASPDAFVDLGKFSASNMEESQTYILSPQRRAYHLRAGTKVKVIAKTKTMHAISHAELLHIPIYEVEITEDSLAGTHVYLIGSSLQMKAALQIGGAWTSSDVSMHDALVMEDDNPAFALREYANILVTDQNVFSLPGRARPSVIALAREKLTAAGITPPEPLMQGGIKPGLHTMDVPEEEPAPVAPRFGKPLAAPKEESKALTVDLLDTSWEHSSSGSYIYIYVKVRNTSGTTLNRLKVTASLEQQDNSIVSTEYTYLEPTVIEPSGVALAKLMVRANSLIHHYNLTFETKGREVKFNNRTR